MTHINIYDGSRLIGVVADAPATAWRTAVACVRGLASDAGPGRVSAPSGWMRTPGRNSYQRSGFRAVNTFRAVAP